MAYKYQVDIAGTMYGMNDIKSVTLEHPLFEKFSVGNACSAELDITLWQKSDIPKMAKIVPYCRESDTDAWYQIGVYFIDTRSKEGNALKLVAYDCMLKAEAVWVPEESLNFPMTMETAAEEISRLMDTELDPRCTFNSSYTIDYPANDYTLRDILRYIAAAHAGNWIVTNDGKLLLVPLFASMPPETNYLITENGNAITLGGVRLLV